MYTLSVTTGNIATDWQLLSEGFILFRLGGMGMATDTVTSEHDDDVSSAVSDGPEQAFLYRLLHALVLPAAIVILALLYIENTWGSIEQHHLAYPYFAIAVLLSVLSITVGREIRDLRAEYSDDPDTPSLTESVRNAVIKHKLGLAILALLTVYVFLIEILGFLISSFLVFFAVARTLTDDSYLRTIIWMVVTVGIIYILFVTLLGIRAPTGILGI